LCDIRYELYDKAETCAAPSHVFPDIAVEFFSRGDSAPPLICPNGFRIPSSSWDKLAGLLPAGNRQRGQLSGNSAGYYLGYKKITASVSGEF